MKLDLSKKSKIKVGYETEIPSLIAAFFISASNNIFFLVFSETKTGNLIKFSSSFSSIGVSILANFSGFLSALLPALGRRREF